MIEIIRTSNGYRFDRIDGDGERWELGNATERVQGKGTEDEERWFEGWFDTREIAFNDEAELVERIAKREPNDKNEIYFA